MYYLRMLAALLGFIVASAYGIAIAVLRHDRSRVALDYARLLGRLTQPALGVRLRVHGEKHLYAERPCIYIANHQSNFDVPVFAPIYPPDTVVIAKKEIRQIPFFGWLFEATGNILIDRSDRAQAVSRLKEVADTIRERGVSVWIFPEGTRGKEQGKLLPFKKGAFQMALSARVPLVPVVLSPIRRVIDTPARTIRPGTLEVRVLPPIPTAGEGVEMEELLETAQALMSAALAEMAENPRLPDANRAASLPPSAAG